MTAARVRCVACGRRLRARRWLGSVVVAPHRGTDGHPCGGQRLLSHAARLAFILPALLLTWGLAIGSR